MSDMAENGLDTRKLVVVLGSTKKPYNVLSGSGGAL